MSTLNHERSYEAPGSRALLPLSLMSLLLMSLLAGCGGSSGTQNPPADLYGSWGGGTSEDPAALRLGDGGGTLTFSCGAHDQLAQPLVADGHGNFDVTATQYLSLPTAPPAGGSAPQVHLTGTVSGRTMTISETRASGRGTVYTLAYGQAAPGFNGACPG